MAVLFAVVVFGNGALAQITELQNNGSRDNLFAGEGSARYYSINVPPGYRRLVVKTSGDDVGDCDIFVRLGSLPTTRTYDASSESEGNDELVTVTNPASGTWYIMLYAYSTYLSLHFEVLYDGSTDTNVSPGNKVWDVSLDGSMTSSACLAPDGTIYAATETGDLWAVQSNGTALWHKSIGSVSATPALASDGTIYVVRNTGQLLALAPSGSTKWTFTGTTHGSHPVGVSKDGTIYVPSNGNALFAVNSGGTLKWQFATESGYSASSPAVIGADGTIYCGFYHPNLSLGRLYAIGPDGKERWRFNATGKINTPAIDATGAVIFGCPQPVNKVYAIQSTGVKKWESSVSGGSLFSQTYVYSAPVIAPDGTIYISSNRRLIALSSDGREKWHYDSEVLLVEFDLPNGPALDSTGIVYFGSLGVFGAGDLYAVKPDGTLAWKYDVGGEVACPPIITPDGNLVFATANGTRKLFALKAGAGPSQSVWPLSRQNAGNTATVEVGQGSGRPSLHITRSGNQLVFTWQSTPGFILESITTVTASAWATVLGNPVVVGNQFTLTTVLPPDSRFYHLRKP